MNFTKTTVEHEMPAVDPETLAIDRATEAAYFRQLDAAYDFADYIERQAQQEAEEMEESEQEMHHPKKL